MQGGPLTLQEYFLMYCTLECKEEGGGLWVSGYHKCGICHGYERWTVGL